MIAPPPPAHTPALRSVEDAAWHRLSPRMLLVHPIIEIARLSPALIGLAFANNRSDHGIYTGLGAAALVAALAILRWFTTSLRITGEQVELRHGLLRRRAIATRRDRIRTVDVTAHLLHRLLGLARVVIGTGTSDRKGYGRITLDGLPFATATQLRNDLLHRGGVDVTPMSAANGLAVDESPTSSSTSTSTSTSQQLHEIARLDPSWARYAPFTLSGVVTGVIIWGFVWRVQGESGVNLVRSGPLRAAGRSIDHMPTAIAVLIVAISVVVFVAATSTIGYVLSFWNFHLSRHDGGTLQVTRGLITTRATSIERRRLVGAELSETLLLRMVGGTRTLAIATGLRTGRGAERGGEVLLPPAPQAVAERVIAAVLDTALPVTAPLVEHGRGARRRRIIRAVAGSIVLLAAALIGYGTGGSIWPVTVALVLVAASVPLGLDRYANLGHTVVHGYLVTRFGSIIRRRSMLADHAVIGWTVRRTFFQRRLGLATITATTAAGKQAYAITDVGLDVALQLADAVTPGLFSQFRLVPQRARPLERRPSPVPNSAPRATLS